MRPGGDKGNVGEARARSQRQSLLCLTPSYLGKEMRGRSKFVGPLRLSLEEGFGKMLRRGLSAVYSVSIKLLSRRFVGERSVPDCCWLAAPSFTSSSLSHFAST